MAEQVPKQNQKWDDFSDDESEDDGKVSQPAEHKASVAKPAQEQPAKEGVAEEGREKGPEDPGAQSRPPIQRSNPEGVRKYQNSTFKRGYPNPKDAPKKKFEPQFLEKTGAKLNTARNHFEIESEEEEAEGEAVVEKPTEPQEPAAEDKQ